MVKCEKKNQVFETRSECPKTCLKPTGIYDCGEKKPVEGCYCTDGYVLDGDGNCILPSACGCLTADNSSIINVWMI